MSKKKWTLPLVLLAFTMVAYIVATLILCYKTKPAVTSGEFPFSITYEYKGETKTISGVFECEFSGSGTMASQHERYWNSDTIIENPVNLNYPNAIEQDEEKTLVVHEHMIAGYFMGDPLYKDYYNNYYQGKIEPYIDYYDYVNEISINDENREEIMESIGFRFVDFTYPEPIENSFSFSGVLYCGDNIIFFVAIMLLVLLICVIFVRKDKEYKYSIIDKLGILFNFVIGIFAVPFVTLICAFSSIFLSDTDIISQIAYNIPPFTVFCIALSVVFRRKGLRKTGFFVQFGGVILFALWMLSDIFI